MRKLIALLFVILLFSIPNDVSATKSEVYELGERVRIEKTEKWESLLEHRGLAKDFHNFGYNYVDEQGKMIVQIAKDVIYKDPTLAIKIESAIDELVETYGQNDVVVKEVLYSYNDLNRKFDEISSESKKIGLDEEYSIALDEIENRVVLTTEYLHAFQEKHLLKKFGDVIHIQLEPVEEASLQSTAENWSFEGKKIAIFTYLHYATTKKAHKRYEYLFLVE